MLVCAMLSGVEEKAVMSEVRADRAARGDEDAIDPLQAVVPQLCDRLRARIIRGELAPGSRLLRPEIAARYGVSRQPVSEACIRLSEESLVDVLPQRGTFVSRIRVGAVMSARFVREAVEADIVRLVAAEPSEAVLGECERLLERQRIEIDRDDPQPFIALDEAFHHQLARAAGQGTGWDILEPLKIQMDRVRYLNVRHFPRQQILEQHAAILAAIRAADSARAETVMRTHLRQMLDDLPRAVEARPDYFDTRGTRL